MGFCEESPDIWAFISTCLQWAESNRGSHGYPAKGFRSLAKINHLDLLRSTWTRSPDKNLNHVQDDTNTALISRCFFVRRSAVPAVDLWSLNMTLIATAAIAHRSRAEVPTVSVLVGGLEIRPAAFRMAEGVEPWRTPTTRPRPSIGWLERVGTRQPFKGISDRRRVRKALKLPAITKR